MDIYRQLDEYPRDAERAVVTIGKFDGAHLGHATILRTAVERARVLNARTVVFTFDPSPATILRPRRAPEPLCDLESKLELFSQFGLDAAFVYPTTRRFLQTTARDFFYSVVLGVFRARALVEGENFRFGRDRGSDLELGALCRENDVELTIVPTLQVADERVSSSRVRELVARGDVENARLLLGRPYALKGRVESGDRRGRELGFPTANLGSYATLVPSSGVYAAVAELDNGERRAAAVNIGGNPTFNVQTVKIEAHLLDFSGDLYEKPLSLLFLAKIRDVVSFHSVDELKAQMAQDLITTRALCEPFLAQS